MAFGQFDQTNSGQPMAEINTTPLVDVMLVLLVIFIITAPLFTHAVKLDLPNAPAQSVNEKPETIQVAINAAGQYFWNDQAIAFADLQTQLSLASKKTPQPDIHLRADKATRYEQVAEVMAAAQQAGLSKIGFVTEPKPKK